MSFLTQVLYFVSTYLCILFALIHIATYKRLYSNAELQTRLFVALVSDAFIQRDRCRDSWVFMTLNFVCE